jgi:hypothetical protein
MPGFDGTGPQGHGPMTGRARGYCILRTANDESNRMQGFAGVQGTPIDAGSPEGQEATDMAFRDGTGPVASRPMVGRPVAHPVPRCGNPVLIGGMLPFGGYTVAPYGYCRPRFGRGLWRPWFGHAFGHGRGRRRGRGRAEFPW